MPKMKARNGKNDEFVFRLDWEERRRYRMHASNPKGLPWIQSHKICSNIQRTHSWMNHKNWYSYQHKIGAKVFRVGERKSSRAHSLLLLWINEMSVEKCMNKRNARFNAIKCEKQASILLVHMDLLRCCLPIAISFRCLHSTGLRRVDNGMNAYICQVFIVHILFLLLDIVCLPVRWVQYKRLLTFNQRPNAHRKETEEQERDTVRVQSASNFTAVRTA